VAAPETLRLQSCEVLKKTSIMFSILGPQAEIRIENLPKKYQTLYCFKGLSSCTLFFISKLVI
jgi:hypothetical protein